ncbi:MAG: hypothetical protein ACR2QM_12375, partial [Longimicrobiales bacterium]
MSTISQVQASFVPGRLLGLLPGDPRGPGYTVEPGTVVFADIAGFTGIAESLFAEHGREGAEALGALLNQSFGLLIKIVQR